MSSAICQNFVQNAWKKDLCSNCFKSKDEHSLGGNKPRPAAVVPSAATVESIIKATSMGKERPKLRVVFTKELTKIIGYGGEDWSDDEEEAELDDDDEQTDEDYDEEIAFSDDDQELIKLTRANTDYNANNLQNDVGESSKKTYSNLMLGKPLLDAEGRKQTLLVSVTPFGQQKDQKTKELSGNKSHIPIAKPMKELKELVETKSNVVLTSYANKGEEIVDGKAEKSLLEEISETLENGKNPIQIVSRKKTQKDIVLNVTKPRDSHNKENVVAGSTIAESTGGGNGEKAKSSNLPERKIGITRAPMLKHQEKPIYQTSVAKIELLNNCRNLKLSGKEENHSNNNNNSNHKSAKSESNRSIKPEQNNNLIDNKPLDVGERKPTGDSLEAAERHEDLMSATTTFDNVPESREQAGEPDGKADPDVVHEPPALPLTPPPQLESPASFLHGNNNNNNPNPYDNKPKVPIKPFPPRKISPSSSVAQPPRSPSSVAAFHGGAFDGRQQHQQFLQRQQQQREEYVVKLAKHDSNGSDVAKSSNKRRAPRPPPSPSSDEPAIFNRNSTGTIALESPDKKYRNNNEDDDGDDIVVIEQPRANNLSVSIDNLTNDEKKKEKRARFSLKKFLRMGTKSDTLKIQQQQQPHLHQHQQEAIPARLDDNTDASNRPRLVIVHPLDLNGAKVEVVTKPLQSDCNGSGNQSDYAVPSNVRAAREIPGARGPKPLPPPRNLDDWKPLPQHPPKSAEIVHKQRQFSATTTTVNGKKGDTVYANIGEVRSAITPNKPQRTASMREREALQQQQQQARKSAETYEPIGLQAKDPSENVYDYINRSSSPESDSLPDKNGPIDDKSGRLINNGRRAGSSVDVAGDYFKYANAIPRSVSLTYCGSETESEIYAPYSFYGSETEVAEDDVDWTGQNGKTYKLRSRKGRSIVHKNLEDNYGAVIVANHEALAQVLENIQHSAVVQPALRGLKTLSNLRWSDFVVKSSPPLPVGTRTFHQATWNAQHVTLMISFGPSPTTTSLSLGNFVLNPITEFNDLIPTKYLPHHQQQHADHVQATVAVLPWLQVNTIQSYGESIKSRAPQPEESSKETTFALLQLINALKLLQAQGIEELPLALTSFVLCRDVERDVHNRLCVLQGLGEDLTPKQKETGSLCMCASTALKLLMPTFKYAPLIQSLLSNERAVSLTQVKSVLEFSLWGPSDVALGATIKERELALQRWLDLQRATVLHGLVCTKIQLTVYEECHLLFLVRSSAKMMSDASLLLESSNKQNLLLQNGRK